MAGSPCQLIYLSLLTRAGQKGHPDLMAHLGFAFFDIEASGLAPGSYPVEVGWALPDGTSAAMLIRPAQDWTAELWDPAAECIHGLSRDTLLEKGGDPLDAALAMNAALGGRIALSDAHEYDTRWTDMLFREAGEPRKFRIASVSRLLDRLGLTGEDADAVYALARSRKPPCGRAADDALYLLEVFRISLERRRRR